MASAMADLLSIFASWLGLGLVVVIVIALKCWDIYRQHRRSQMSKKE